MTYFSQGGENEMSEDILRARFGLLVNEALLAFSMDSRYATELALKARSIESRRSKRGHR